MQRVDGRLEAIIVQISGEFHRLSSAYQQLLNTNHQMRVEIQNGKDERAKVEAHMRYQNRCLEEEKQRAWHLEERVNKLEVELESQNVGALSTDPSGPACGDERRMQSGVGEPVNLLRPFN